MLDKKALKIKEEAQKRSKQVQDEKDAIQRQKEDELENRRLLVSKIEKAQKQESEKNKKRREDEIKTMNKALCDVIKLKGEKEKAKQNA